MSIMRNFFKYTSLFFLFFGSAANAQNAKTPKFADIFTNDAIIQRNMDVKIWGNGAPNSDLTLKINDRDFAIKADLNGEWNIKLAPSEIKDNSKISILNSEKIGQTIDNIRLGDVFICSGQSNMAFELKYASNAEWEIKNAGASNVWFINVPQNAQVEPQNNFKTSAKWQKANSQNAGEASAVCYFMARQIAKTQKTPVGIINASWGGSHIEPWISASKLRQIGGFENELNLLEIYKNNQEKAKAELLKSNANEWAQIDKGIKENWHLGETKIKWDNILIKENWEVSGIEKLQSFDGVVWFKNQFEIKKEELNQDFTLYLGRIDDEEETFINGQKIGSTIGWDVVRKYNIPSEILKLGSNNIVVKIKDTGGGGGFWGADEVLGLNSKVSQIPLNKNWQYKIGADINDFKGSKIIPWDATNGVSTLYNGMLNPIKNYGFKGFFWYQGESNAGRPEKYGHLLQAFVDEIRQNANDNSLPFFMVQLANFGKITNGNLNSNWAKLRAVQFEATKKDKNIYMVPSIDIGDPYDIHPTQKSKVGERLANSALKAIYNANTDTMPFPSQALRKNKNVEIEFLNTGGGLMAISSEYAIGFEVCEKNGLKCRFINGEISGSNIILKNTSSKEVEIRYLWANSPIANLYGKNGQVIGTFEIMISQ